MVGESVGSGNRAVPAGDPGKGSGFRTTVFRV